MLNKKFVFYCLLIVICFSSFGCKKKHSAIPSGIIKKETMINIMVDVNLIEATLRVKQSLYNKDSSYVKDYYDLVFKKYNITKEQFNNSLKYYSKHPDKFGEIYDEVINKLSRLQSEENSKK